MLGSSNESNFVNQRLLLVSGDLLPNCTSIQRCADHCFRRILLADDAEGGVASTSGSIFIVAMEFPWLQFAIELHMPLNDPGDTPFKPCLL